MKFFLLLLLTAFTQRSFSQDILIPYRAGDKFGLCNQNGKIIVPPAYDRVAWLSNEYFITSKEVTLNDTLEATPYNYRIRNKKVIVKGLLYKNREIFKDEPFRDVEIIPNKCIIAKSEGRYTDYTKEQFAR